MRPYYTSTLPAFQRIYTCDQTVSGMGDWTVAAKACPCHCRCRRASRGVWYGDRRGGICACNWHTTLPPAPANLPPPATTTPTLSASSSPRCSSGRPAAFFLGGGSCFATILASLCNARSAFALASCSFRYSSSRYLAITLALARGPPAVTPCPLLAIFRRTRGFLLFPPRRAKHHSVGSDASKVVS